MHPNGNDPYGNQNNPHDYAAQPGAFQSGFQNQGGYGQAPAQQPQYGGFAQPQANPQANAFGHAHAQHAHSHGAGMISCPKCHKPSDSIKAYTMMSFLLFIWVGAWWRTKKVVACGGCMRQELVISSLINTVAANLLCPIVWIWHTVLFCMTFGKGHSPEVIGYLR